MTTQIGPIEFEDTMRFNAFIKNREGQWVRPDKPEITIRYTLDGVIFHRRLAPGLGALEARVANIEGLFRHPTGVAVNDRVEVERI